MTNLPPTERSVSGLLQSWPRAATVAVALAAGLALWLAGPGAARAAIEIGYLPTDAQLETCGGPGAEGLDFVQSSSSAEASYQVPEDGVITSWRYRAGTAPAAIIRLQVWRPVSGAAFTLEGRSDPVTAGGADVVEFPAQVPVTAGSVLGLRAITLAGCVSDESFPGTDAIQARFPGDDPAVGETVTMNLALAASRRVNVAATVEPDIDGDGFGDESQDIALVTKLKRKLGAKGAGFPVRIACGGSECEATVSGKAVAKQKGGKSAAVAKAERFKLKSKTISIAAGATAKTTLKLKQHRKSSRKLSRLLKRDKAFRKGSRLKLTVSATNSLGAADKLKDKAKLKP